MFWVMNNNNSEEEKSMAEVLRCRNEEVLSAPEWG